jgi:hypothetical protein
METTELTNQETLKDHTVKMANEHGIAGFILALVIPIHQHLSFGFNYHPFPIGDNHISDEYEILFWFNVFFMILALVLGFKGVFRKGNYQIGLATWGLIMNILTVVMFIYFTSASNDHYSSSGYDPTEDYRVYDDGSGY